MLVLFKIFVWQNWEFEIEWSLPSTISAYLNVMMKLIIGIHKNFMNQIIMIINHYKYNILIDIYRIANIQLWRRSLFLEIRTYCSWNIITNVYVIVYKFWTFCFSKESLYISRYVPDLFRHMVLHEQSELKLCCLLMTEWELFSNDLFWKLIDRFPGQRWIWNNCNRCTNGYQNE